MKEELTKIKRILRDYDLYIDHTIVKIRAHHYEIMPVYHFIISYNEMITWIEIMNKLEVDPNKSYFSSSKIHLIFNNNG